MDYKHVHLQYIFQILEALKEDADKLPPDEAASLQEKCKVISNLIDWLKYITVLKSHYPPGSHL